jgi:hypothetical protein
LEAVDVDSFKAHDLTLDQTVTVRRALLASQRVGETWRQKVQQLALMRDPNFLNILDVIVDISDAFVITERSRGRSIADLLRESSRLDLEDVLRLMTALARALDLAADLGFCPHPISSRWLFTETRNSVSVDREQRSFSDWPFLIKLDVWELVRPRELASTVYTVVLPGARETIRRFNRDTRWLANGSFGCPSLCSSRAACRYLKALQIFATGTHGRDSREKRNETVSSFSYLNQIAWNKN